VGVAGRNASSKVDWPAGTDQFNSLQEKTALAFESSPTLERAHDFASVRRVARGSRDRRVPGGPRDPGGIRTQYWPIEDIGRTADGRFHRLRHRVIATIFKLYPWEFLLADEFASICPHRPRRGSTTVEVDSVEQGRLALLWSCTRASELLPTFFEQESAAAAPLPAGWVRKPLFSAEGANVELVTEGGERVEAPGPTRTFRTCGSSITPFPDSRTTMR